MRWLRDSVLAEGNISPADVSTLMVCDEIEPAIELLGDVEHRRPRA
jgi:hypothetical protein